MQIKEPKKYSVDPMNKEEHPVVTAYRIDKKEHYKKSITSLGLTKARFVRFLGFCPHN